MRKKVRIKIERIDKDESGYKVRYKYADMKVGGQPLYGARYSGAVDELDAFNKFKTLMAEVNYQVVTEEN
jgi:hypothetical protein